MVIQHNLHAMNANRQLNINTGKQAKVTEKLSSGYRINRAADDAAGLSISEKMRHQIRGLTQASTNSQDGISFVQTAEGAMNEIHAMLQRGNELAVKAANGTWTEKERDMIDQEIQYLKDAINEAGRNTEFNGIKCFPKDGLIPSQAGNETYSYELKYDLVHTVFEVTTLAADGVMAADATGTVSSGNALADHIANELLPNAIAQIFAAFPSLKNATGSDTIDMSLDVSVIDGENGTLAYAQCAFGASGRPVNLLLKVDSYDFDDEDAAGTGENAEVLESTIAHELMHSVMQYNLTDGMTGRTGDKFPTWFTEGTAQLAGGGFPTNWNAALEYYAGQMSSAADTSQDANIADYLNDYTMAGRPYGHGYLGSAYIGYLANINNGGSTAVTAGNIAAGMDKIFSDLLAGKDFATAIKDNTGKTVSEIEAMFANGDSGLVGFVRELSWNAAQGGAGSVIAGSLSAGSTSILGNSAAVQAFRIDPAKVSAAATGTGNGAENGIWIQTGTEEGVGVTINQYKMDTESLGLMNTTVKTVDDASAAINEIKKALEGVSNVRSYYGAMQNRLEHTIKNLNNVVENTQAAESRIRDTDMATAMVEYSNLQILAQAGQSMLAQTNRQPELILGLLS